MVELFYNNLIEYKKYRPMFSHRLQFSVISAKLHLLLLGGNSVKPQGEEDVVLSVRVEKLVPKALLKRYLYYRAIDLRLPPSISVQVVRPHWST